MKIGAVWLSVVLLSGAVLAQEAPPPPSIDPLHAIEIENKQLDLQQRQAELNFQNEMRKIQLEKKRLEVDQERQSLKAKEQKPDGQWGKGPGFHGGNKNKHKWMRCTLFTVVCAVVHVLLAIWVYQDIRRRNAGSGLWIVITLLTGFFGALVYAVVRIGDKPV